MNLSKEMYKRLSAPMKLGKKDDEMAAVIQRLNEVCGPTEWGYNYKPIKETSGRFKTGGGYHQITIVVAIWVMDKELARPAVGGAMHADYTKALEEAIRNAFLRAAAFWGVGEADFGGDVRGGFAFSDLEQVSNGTVSVEEDPPLINQPTYEDQFIPTEAGLRTKSKVMAAEDGAPPSGRMPRTRPQPTAPVAPDVAQVVVEGQERDYMLKMAKQVGRHPAMKAWLDQPHTRAEIQTMGKTLENLVRTQGAGLLPADAG